MFGSIATDAAAPAPRPATPAEIPFVLEDGKIVVDVELKPGGRKLPFVFDTGLTPGNLLTTRAATALGINATESASVGDATGDRQVTQVATLPTIRVGGAALSKQIFALVDLPEAVARTQQGAEIGGFLGAPLMDDAVLCLDYQHQKMQRWTRAGFDPKPMAAVPLTLNHGLPIVVVEIDGKPANLIVDSGNNAAVVLYPAYARASGIPDRYPNLQAHSGGTDGGGQQYDSLGGEAKEVRIGGGALFHQVPFEIIPQGMDPAWGIDGMIGFEVLSALDPCLDVAGGKFYMPR